MFSSLTPLLSRWLTRSRFAKPKIMPRSWRMSRYQRLRLEDELRHLDRHTAQDIGYDAFIHMNDGR
jgi:hypothetical protein